MGQDLPGLQGGDGAFAGCPVTSPVAVDRPLVAGQPSGPAPERDGDVRAGALVGQVGVGPQVAVDQGVDHAVGTCRGQVVGRAGQPVGDPHQVTAAGIDESLQVDAVLLVLAAVVQPVPAAAEPVDGDQGAVEDAQAVAIVGQLPQPRTEAAALVVALPAALGRAGRSRRGLPRPEPLSSGGERRAHHRAGSQEAWRLLSRGAEDRGGAPDRGIPGRPAQVPALRQTAHSRNGPETRAGTTQGRQSAGTPG